MAKNDEAFLFPSGQHVAGVFDAFPFAGFTDDEDVYIGVVEGAFDAGEVVEAGREGYAADGELRVADDAQRACLEAGLHTLRELGERRCGQRELAAIVRRKILLPAERGGHASEDAIGLARVPVIVEAPDDEAVLFDEVALGLVNLAAQTGRVIGVIIEGRLVDDDQIQPSGVGALAYVQRTAEGSRDAFDGVIGIARFESVYGVFAPFDADLFLNAFDDLACRESGKGRCAVDGVKSGSGDGEKMAA